MEDALNYKYQYRKWNINSWIRLMKHNPTYNRCFHMIAIYFVAYLKNLLVLSAEWYFIHIHTNVQRWRIKWKAVLYLSYRTGNIFGVLYSTVRCEKHIVNNETRWCIQVNSAKISLLTKTLHMKSSRMVLLKIKKLMDDSLKQVSLY